MLNQKIIDSIKKARENKKRNFKQTFDLVINLKNIDMRKAENKIKFEVDVPNMTKENIKIGLIVDALASSAANIDNVHIIRKEELENLGKNKKLVKKIAKECDYFIAEAPLMPLIGKNLGSVLAPRNLMPKPVPPSANLEPLVEEARKTIRIQLKDSPVIHLAIGTEDMEDDKIADNADTVIQGVILSLPKGREQIKNFVIKMTMGKPVKFVL
jgi:large subunit ribosomal protein L1